MIRSHRFCIAALPADEQQRIESLLRLRVLDSVPEREFDDIAALAAGICATPIALISLIDRERQWFKSRIGLDVCETHRDLAFCSHAILDTQLFEIPDAAEDDRFADNPLVTGAPHIRFYAGAPLILENGLRIGTVCVIDTVPRKLDRQQADALTRLARLTVSNLQARRAKFQTEDQERLLLRVLEAMPDALVTCDEQGKLNLFNAVARSWHGIDPQWAPAQSWAENFDLYRADGHTLLPTDEIPLQRAFRGESVHQQEICIKAKGQAPRSVLCNGSAIENEQGERAGALVLMHDITDRRAAERAIAEARGYLQAVIDASLDVAMIATDSEGIITLFNSGAERLLGYRAAEMIGKLTPAVFHLPAEVLSRGAELSAAYGRKIEGFEVFVARAKEGVSETRQWTYVTKQGEHRQVRLSVSAISNAEGQAAGFLGMAIDLSSQLAAEATALMNERRFSGAFQGAAQGMALVSIEGRFIEVNDAACQILGYPREELLCLDFQQITHAEDLRADIELLQQVLAGRIPSYQLRKRYWHKDGALVSAMLSVSLVRDSHGQALHFVAQIQDITDQVRAEQALLDSANYVDSLLENIADGIISVNAQGQIMATNRAMCHLVGRPDSELIGSRLSDLISETSAKQLEAGLASRENEQALVASKRHRLQIVDRSGEAISVELAISALQRRGERHLVCLFRDLREQERIEALKQSFVATVCHELRTPLTAIAASLKLLHTGAVGSISEKQTGLLELSLRNSERLGHLIDDLLDFEKLSAGRMQLNLGSYSLSELLSELRAQHQSFADRMKVPVKLGDLAECTVRIDRQRFSQVVSNLLSNACKFSPPGAQVELGSYLGDEYAWIEVRDHGSGIPESFRQRVFERFSQADGSDRRGQPGTGLGLAICRELVQLMGGEIGFDSEPGVGTTFRFSVPLG